MRIYAAKKSDQLKCLSYRIFSSYHCKGIQRWVLEAKTLLCFSFAKMAIPDGTGTGKPTCCTPISTQWPNRTVLGLERLWTSHKSASNITYSANVSRKCSARVLRTVKHAISAYSSVRPPAQCSVLCMPRCFTSPYHLHNINASRLLVPQYRDASAVLYLVHSMYHAWDCTCSTVTLCILNFAGGFPHTIRSTFRSQRSHVSWVHACLYDPT